MRKSLIILIILLSIPYVFASVDVKTKVINDVVIKELKNPAIFEITLENKDVSDSFSIYSLANVDIRGDTNFYLGKGGKKKIRIEVIPHDTVLKRNEKIFPFVLKIRGENSGIKEKILTLKILRLNDAIEVGCYEIYPNDSVATIYIKNNVALNFSNIQANIHSVFFDFKENFSLSKMEKKEFNVSINQEKIKELEAGTYILSGNLKINGKIGGIEGVIKFREEALVETEEKKEGIFIKRFIIEKRNIGNLPTIVEIKIRKNIISRLFVNFNVVPSKVERRGVNVYYLFKKEIRPAESFVVIATTNLFYPLFILMMFFTIVFILYLYTYSDVIIEKKAKYVKTKGGEFALKIYITIKAKKFVEKISIIDKIPPLFKLHKDFGVVPPERIDEKNRRLEWTIDSLQAGEERKFSYIIYSKIAPIGKLELPSTSVVYERDGKIKEVLSNKVFFFTEVKENK